MNNSRYVYFKSLEKTHPDIYSSAQAEFSSINNMFNKELDKTVEVENGLNYMQKYLSFIKQLAENERANEIAYFNNYIKIFKENPALKKNKKISEIISIFENQQSFDYIKFIALINELRDDLKVYKQDKQNIIERMKNLKNISSKSVEEEITRIKNISKNKEKNEERNFKNQAKSNIKHKIIQSTETITEKMANRINIIFQEEIFKNNSILELIKNYLQEHYSTEGLDKILENLVVKYVKTNFKKDQNFSNWLQKDFEKKIEDAKKDTYYTVFDSMKKVSIEEEILKGTEDIANKFLNYFSPETQIKIIEQYASKNNNLRELYDNLIKSVETNNSIDKTKFTRELKKAVEERLKKEKLIDEKETLTDFQDKKNKTEILEKITDYLPDTYYIKIKPFQVAELIAENLPLIKSKITQMIGKTSIPGQKINLKNDINISYSFQPKNIDKKYISELNNEIENFMNNFINSYYEIGKGSTKVEIAAQVYLEKMEILSKEYQKSIELLKKNNQLDKIPILEEIISNTFLGGISVKEYTYYDEKLGFHGGSLGGGGKVVEAIPNIIKMYELGGIDIIDSEIIIKALLNCSQAMIGGDCLNIENLKNYLIGGAAMVMFDDGFVSATNFLEQIKKMFNGIAPKGIHLYQLQTYYIPASYVLQNIYENLNFIVQDINNMTTNPERLTSKEISSSLIVKNNITENSIIKDKDSKKYLNADYPSNWERFSQYAQDKVTISFHFMAGILDIFEKLPNAFNIK